MKAKVKSKEKVKVKVKVKRSPDARQQASHTNMVESNFAKQIFCKSHQGSVVVKVYLKPNIMSYLMLNESLTKCQCFQGEKTRYEKPRLRYKLATSWSVGEFRTRHIF